MTAVSMGAAALGSLLIPANPWRRRAFSGVLLLGLALASHRRLGDSGVTVATYAITLGIGLLGVLVLAAALVAAFRGGGRGAAGWWAAGLVLVAGTTSIGQLLPPVWPAGWSIALATTVSLAATGGLAGVLGPKLRLAQAVRRLDRALSPVGGAAGGPPWDPWQSRLLTVLVLGAALALVALQLHVLLGAVALSACAGMLLERRTGRGGFPVVFVLALLVLVMVWGALVRVAGGMPLGLLALGDAPYSPAFEVLMAPALALLAWSFLGLWPFHLSIRGPVMPLLGATLVVRLLAPVLPHGLEHWQPILYPLAVAAAWHGAASARDAETLTAVGALGMLSGDAVAGWAGLALAGVGVVFEARRRLLERGLDLNPRGRVAVAALLVLAAILLVPVISGALGAEVLYSVLAVAGGISALWS